MFRDAALSVLLSTAAALVHFERALWAPVCEAEDRVTLLSSLGLICHLNQSDLSPECLRRTLASSTILLLDRGTETKAFRVWELPGTMNSMSIIMFF